MSFPTEAPAGQTLVSGDIIALGVPAAGYKLSFTPEVITLDPTAHSLNGTAVATEEAYTVTCDSSGHFAINLPDTTLTNPVHISYRVRCFNLSNREVFGLAYKTIQPSGSTWSLNTAQPSLSPQVPVVQGARGPDGAPGISSLAQLAAADYPLLIGQNLHNQATDQAGYFLITDDGTLGGGGTYAGLTTTDYFRLNSGGSMCINPAPFSGGGQSVAMYDQDKNFVGNASISGGVFSVPSNCALGRTTIDNSNLGSTMIEWGSVAHSWREFSTAAYTNSTIDSHVAVATNAAVTAAAQASGLSGTVVDIIAGVNLLDLTKVMGGYYLPLNSAGSPVSFDAGASVTGAIDVIPGGSISVSGASFVVLGGNNVYTFYNPDGSYAGGSSPAPSLETPITVPGTAVKVKFNISTASMPGTMIYVGTKPPSYTSYGLSGLASRVSASTPAQGGAGKNIGIFGDSYTQGTTYQNGLIAATGFNISFQDGLGSRAWYDLLESYCGGTTGPWSSGTTYSLGQTVTVVMDTSGAGRVFRSLTNGNINNPPRTSPSQWAIDIGTNSGSARGNTYYNTGTLGNTLAQDLSAANIVALLIYLGTNDVPRVSAGGPTGLGSYGDAANSGTIYGDIRSGIELVQTQLATLSAPIPIIICGPMYTASHSVADVHAVNTALEQVAADYGVPVINGVKVFGVSSVNASVRLQDGLHPVTATQGNRVNGAVIGRYIVQHALGS